MLLPDYPTDDLETRSARARLRQHHLHAGRRGHSSAAPLRLMVTPLRAPSDGPIGDSSLSRRRRHRQHPEPERLAPARSREAARRSASPRRTSRSSPARSGGRWSTTCRRTAKQNFAHLKREAQHKRAMFYIEKVDADARLPDGGAADVPARRAVPLQRPRHARTTRSSPTRREFIAHMERAAPRSTRATCSSPARSSSSNGGEMSRHADAVHGCRDRARCSPTSGATSTQQRDARQAEIADGGGIARRRSCRPTRCSPRSRSGGSRCCAAAASSARASAAPVRYTIGDLDMVVDFPKAKVREYAGEETQLLVHDPRRPRLDEHPRPRDRLVQLDLPVDAVRRPAASASSTSSSTPS